MIIKEAKLLQNVSTDDGRIKVSKHPCAGLGEATFTAIPGDGISSHCLKRLRHNRMCTTPSVYLDERPWPMMTGEFKTTPERLQVESVR